MKKELIFGKPRLKVGSPLHHCPGCHYGIIFRLICVVFLMQGDGEQGAIGLGYFMAAALRSEKLTVIGLNNACYGTTGGQMAPTSLIGMKTATTPYGRDPSKEGFHFHPPEA